MWHVVCDVWCRMCGVGCMVWGVSGMRGVHIVKCVSSGVLGLGLVYRVCGWWWSVIPGWPLTLKTLENL